MKRGCEFVDDCRTMLVGLGFSPQAHPLPPLARTLSCFISGASPLNFAGYLLRDGRELRKTSHRFLKQITQRIENCG